MGNGNALVLAVHGNDIIGQSLCGLGYRKDIQGTKVPSFIYKKYPHLREAINRRSHVYNEQLELVERLEDAGEITVIRPQKPIVVDRIERDVKNLTDLYEE